MDSPLITPDGIDTTVPSPCRMYDYYLGGSHHFAADRAAANQVLAIAPWTRAMAISNRAFLRRVVTYLVEEADIRQFLDLGSGVPTVGNVHEVAQAVAPETRVVYVDVDPVAVAHSRFLLATNKRATVIPADIREPASVQRHPDLLSMLDMSKPVAVLMLSILPFITDAERPIDLVAAFVNELARDSFLAISHASLDGTDNELRATVEKAAEVYTRAGAPVALRGRDEIANWFGRLALLAPGVVPIPDWRPDPLGQPEFSGMPAFGGVGRVVA